MSRQQMRLIFLCNLLIFTIANGLLPIWPVYVRQLGATATETGIYLAFAYLMLVAGTVLTGFLAGRFNNRRLFLLSTCGSVLMLWITASATTPIQLTAFTALAWFVGGIQATLLHLYVGRFASADHRGKTFSLLVLAIPLGALIGGATLGGIVDRFNFPTLLRLLAVSYLVLLPLGHLALRRDPSPPQSENLTSVPAKQVSQFALAFKLLLAIALLYNITVFIGRLSTSLSMETLDFSTTAVSSTMAVGGLIAIPFIVWIGDLSDRLGRRRFLAFNFAAAVVGILLLGASTQLWHFWLVGALLSIANYASGPVTAALATDLLAQGALNKGLALINGMAWLAAIIGFAAAGILMDSIGPTRLYLIGAGLSLVALLCTGFLPGKRALSLQIPATAQSASGLRDNALHQ